MTEAYDKQELPDMTELLLLCQGCETEWFWFADNVVECVSGKRAWGKEKSTKVLAESVTSSDEAFALLILINNWDKWLAEEEKPPRKTDPMYTGSTKGNKKFQGWSDLGIAKYNELLEKVEQDRDSMRGKEIERAFLQAKSSNSATRKRTSDCMDNGQFKVRARSNLFRKLPNDRSLVPIGTGYEVINSYEGETGVERKNNEYDSSEDEGTNCFEA
jgi:hypothetical protein